MTMKKAQSKKRTFDMKSEYRFDYSKSRPNRFARKMSEGTVAVVLDADVATVFNSSESVNDLLRSVIKAMPERATKRRAG